MHGVIAETGSGLMRSGVGANVVALCDKPIYAEHLHLAFSLDGKCSS